MRRGTRKRRRQTHSIPPHSTPTHSTPQKCNRRSLIRSSRRSKPEYVSFVLAQEKGRSDQEVNPYMTFRLPLCGKGREGVERSLQCGRPCTPHDHPRLPSRPPTPTTHPLTPRQTHIFPTHHLQLTTPSTHPPLPSPTHHPALKIVASQRLAVFKR